MAGFVFPDRIGTVGENLWVMCKECEAQGTPRLFKSIGPSHVENAYNMTFQNWIATPYKEEI